MTNFQINNYGAGSTSGTSPTTGSQSSSEATLDTSAFLNLLAAQMSNQDVMNPMQDTEFISQMAQFSSLQAMQNVYQISSSQFGSSLVGKKVNVAQYDETGKYLQDSGVVTKCDFTSDGFTIRVNGKSYSLSSVMEVVSDSGSSNFQYGASLVGKKVTVTTQDSSDKPVEETGVVSSCNFSSGTVSVVVNGKTYDLSAITKISSDTADSSSTTEKPATSPTGT